MLIPSLIVVALTGSPTDTHPVPPAPVQIDLTSLVDLEFDYEPTAHSAIIDPGMLQDEAATQEEEMAEHVIEPVAEVIPFGSMASQRWTIQAGGGIDVDESDNWFVLGGLGYTYFIVDYVSVNLELNGIWFNQEGNDPWGGNFNLLFRWHFLIRDTWTMFGDAGAGMMYTSNDVPDNGSSFNFTPQAGLGFSFDMGNENRLMTGIRWQHVSNANTGDTNPGRDHVMAWVGVSFPF